MKTKTIKELQAEVLKLEKEAKDVSTKVDLQASYKGIKQFNADLVINELNSLATYHENLSVKYNDFSKEDLNQGETFWANEADNHYQVAKGIRQTMINIVRTQKQL